MPKLAALLAATLLATAAAAQTPTAQTPAAQLDAAARRAAVEKAAAALRSDYIFPDVGARAAEKIEAALAAGAYDGLSERSAFAARLTQDLAEIAKDKHLRVHAMGGTPPAAPPAGAQGAPPATVRSEAGVVRADRLAGGVGYIEVNGFPPADMFRPSLDRAMAALAGAPALIVDVRRNGGGDPVSVAYLVSHFLDGAKPVLVNRFVKRSPGTAEFTREEFWSSPTPTRAFAGKPLYVLTSARTFSAGEEFPYDIQALKLGVLVGETTGGGANPGGMRPLSPQLAIFLPNGRAENPVTKTNWEGVGVVPDIAVPPAEALRVALQRLGQAPEAADIEALSQDRLFTPRTTRQPGTETALRRMIEELVAGEIRYDRMSPTMARVTREQLPRLRETLQPFGALQAVTFDSVGPMGFDTYDVRFANGVLSWGVGLDAQDRVVMSGFRVVSGPEAASP